MSSSTLFTLIIIVLSPVRQARSQQEAAPVFSREPLTAEEIAIYRTFLEHYDNGSHAPLHLSNRTEALGEPEPSDDSDAPSCIKRLKLVNEKGRAGVVHTLDPSLAIQGRVILVNPDQQAAIVKANDPSRTMHEGKSSEDAVDGAFASGLLTLSEIAFDKRHHVAAMSFSFWCGRLCGHGAVVIFKKIDGRWKISEKTCVEWVS